MLFCKPAKKQSTKIKEHEQETNSSRLTCSTSVSQTTEFGSAKERINANRSNIASDDIAKILPPNGSNNFVQLYLLKTVFRSVGEAVMAFDYKKCCPAKGQRFRYLNENFFRTYSGLVYSESRKGLYCKNCATISSFFQSFSS